MEISIIVDKLREMGVDPIEVKGNNVMIRCHFHPDNNPSFGIHPDKGANCFACMTKFPTADKALAAIAEKLGVEYTSYYTLSADFFDFAVAHDADPDPLNPKVLRFYEKDDDHFVETWKIERDIVQKWDLALDPYSHAECFPVFDSNDDFWGCVERTVPDFGRSRYHYPPNFPRRRLLIGEQKATEEVWVVEGIRDLCAVESKTGNSAVALGGAKVSKKQIDLLLGYDAVTLCLDNDDAGRRARDYLIDRLPGSSTYVAKYKGKDPMEAENFQVKKASGHWLTFA